MKAIDLFCGCGGMSLGFQNAGIRVLAAYDNWKAALDIYRENFDHPAIQADLNNPAIDLELAKWKPDLIFGGPPCQDFSIAGKRKLGARANLTLRFAEIISKLRPEWFVMENVYNIERMPILPKALAVFKAANYGLTKRVLDASRCGVPQKRMRFVLIGHLGDRDDALGPTLDAGLAEHPMTIHDYLGDSLGTEFYYMHPRSYNRRAVFSIHEPSSTIRSVNRPIPENYKRHPADKADVSDGVRALTTRERSYIQTFPQSFAFPGQKSDVERAIGNAVPVKLAEYVARMILSYPSSKQVAK